MPREDSAHVVFFLLTRGEGVCNCFGDDYLHKVKRSFCYSQQNRIRERLLIEGAHWPEIFPLELREVKGMNLQIITITYLTTYMFYLNV